MKNHQEHVIGLVDAMSKDIALTFPHLTRMSNLCSAHFARTVLKHGLAHATLTLPKLGKWFDACLDAGVILPDRPLYHGRRGSTIYPSYLFGLWELIFDESGVLRSDPDHTAVLFLRQSYFFAKKLDLECEKERTYEAVESFKRLDASMVRSYPDTWDSDTPRWTPLRGHPLFGVEDDARQHQMELPTLGREITKRIPWERFDALCRAIVTSFGDLNIWDLMPKHGPGAVSDGLKGTVKYDLPVWPKKLGYLFPPDWFASTNLVDRTQSDREPSSKLCAVPKTQKGPRLIATEPTAHQWVQGSLLRWLEEAVIASPLSISIDYRDQSYSQGLALSSSKDKRFATIDLSEASDRISTRLVQFVFQGHQTLLDCLHACRTRSMTIPASLSRQGVDELINLNKFSTMGSAVTFPVQTIIFTILAHFAIMVQDDDWDVSAHGVRRRAPYIRTFGDDIIVRNDVYDVLSLILTECGLKVNAEKSFTQGLFREACGMDAFDGVCVTPAYFRKPYEPSKPESLSSVIECSNNFHKKGMWKSADYLMRTIPSDELDLILRSRKALWSLTLLSYCDGTDLSEKTLRWNSAYHRVEALTIQLSAKDRRVKGSGEASLLQYFTEDPSKSDLSEWESGQVMRPSIKKARRWVGIE